MADLFDVLADSTRRDLLTALRASAADTAAGELSVGQLVSLLGLTQPTVSKHLRVLRDNQLVCAREVGQHRLYRLDPTPLAQVQSWLVPFFTVAVAVAVAVDGAAAGEDSVDQPAHFNAAPDASRPVFAAFTAAGVPAFIRRTAAMLQSAPVSGAALGRGLSATVVGARSARDRIGTTIRHRLRSPRTRTV